MKPWQWWAIGLGVAAAAAVAAYAGRSLFAYGAEYTHLYKGFTIRITCGALGPGCAAGWNIAVGGTTYNEAVTGADHAATLAAAQARIDTYSSDVVPAAS